MNILKLPILTLAFLMSGCATTYQSAFNLPDKSKVGYHIDLHENIGVTKQGSVLRIIGESSIEVEGLNWNLHEYATGEVMRILEKYGFSPVDVSEVLLNEPTGLYVKSKEPRLLRRKEAEAFNLMHENVEREYAEKYDVAAVVSIVGKPVIISRGSGSASNSVTWAPYHGYFYKTALTSDTVHSVLYAVSEQVFLLNPSRRVVNWEGPYENGDLLFNYKKEIAGFKPIDSKNLSDSEWQRVEKELKVYISERIERNIRALRAGADGQGGYISTP